jgi:hypothetical protein
MRKIVGRNCFAVEQQSDPCSCLRRVSTKNNEKEVDSWM